MLITKINFFAKYLILVIIIWLVIRLFVIQAYTVPTASMSNTFVEGDKVFVNKLAFGARVPITPLSVHFGKTKKYIDLITLPYIRFFGYTSIKQNDILAFNLPSETEHPVDEKKEMLKRCVALPGNFIEIKNAHVYVNSVLQNEEFVLQKNASFTQENYSPTVFPHHGNFKWNLDFFGPLYIPKKGQSITLNTKTLTLYKYIIETHEGCSVLALGNDYYINGEKTKTYTFKMNYYFVLGDNRYNSIDSRYWGFLPENHIIGIAF